ncbi:uncharacterized protein LOC109512149 isoform X2 [Hippocampus comes]|uniref:uncharacterized protein LOC109512149 isoform X2 n=1 Tax=Hippocampus comes TaxID=109280 RepID=UPI00094EBF83|nr:PREDICTED: uncharacterized protein LOC109512149 isoform X2 [Hippocampus comes]
MSLPHASALVFLLLAGSADAEERVRYSSPTMCAVRSSTLTLLCSFTGVRPVVRVVWCVNHLICHGTTPSVYDSKLLNNNWRYLYLGDLERNCTLQINNIQKQDSATFRFRMEATERVGHFTGVKGVRVTVVDGDPMMVQSSAPGHVREGAKFTLSCTSRCSFHNLNVQWYRDGRALTESGPALQLTAEQSANYTCVLADRADTMSLPFRLTVERHPVDGPFAVPLAISLGLLMVLLLVVALTVFLVKRNRRPASRQNGASAEKEHETGEHVYSNTMPGGERGGPDGQEMDQRADEVNYAAVQFKPKAINRPAATQDDVVYSSVARPSQ